MAFRRLLEVDVGRPLISAATEPTDSVSLTQSETWVLFLCIDLRCFMYM